MFKETRDGVEMWCVNDRDMCAKYSAQIQSAGTNCPRSGVSESIRSAWTDR